MSSPELIIMASVATLAAFAIGITGFGFGLITMSVFPNFLSVSQSAALVAVISFGVVIANLWPIRSYIRLRLLWPLLVSALAGVPLGVLFLVRFNETVLRIGLGSLILITLVFDIVRKKRAEHSPSIAVACGVGLVSGAFGGAFTVSGPPVVLYLSSIIKHKYELKANLLAYFLTVAVVRLPFFVASGVLSLELFRIALIVLAPMVGGMLLGMFVFKRLDEKIVRGIVRVFLAVTAVLLILRS